jgi:hypothetical protein
LIVASSPRRRRRYRTLATPTTKNGCIFKNPKMGKQEAGSGLPTQSTVHHFFLIFPITTKQQQHLTKTTMVRAKIRYLVVAVDHPSTAAATAADNDNATTSLYREIRSAMTQSFGLVSNRIDFQGAFFLDSP